MALPTTYNTGTASVNANGTAVTGQGTSWLTSGVQAGDMFWAAGLSVRIASVNSNTSLTLAFPWPGTTRAADSYEVRFTPDATRALAAAREVLDKLTNGNLYSIAGLTTAANKLAYYTGAGAAALADFRAKGRELAAAADAAAAISALGLLPVQSDRSDTMANRLLRSGAFGLGSTAPELGATDDVNSLPVITGFYNWGSPGPINSPSTFCTMIQIARNSGTIWQIAFSNTRIFTRNTSSGTWLPWTSLPQTAVGAVAASGNGAIIERGSNSNGEYVRFADGTQICFQRVDMNSVAVDTAAGSLFRSPLLNWSFPAAFSSFIAANVQGHRSNDAIVAGGSVRNFSNTAIDYLLTMSTAQAANSGGKTVQLSAIGRWF